ncbi:uncharacterized protein PgNI_04951 [Pyricularia grisea]|uniref:AAA+ ATPase domain-containing protein n=1 Tax=Pyricularia grisea TaxID=148305 RepID=A0A6P8B9J4_PYRGI|nr:uncharacterized protein PgNI_04951 [Pyricularia grisea]TLD12337.1 hypothetical protein PgNI_04951 [Pyricularia grisea]
MADPNQSSSQEPGEVAGSSTQQSLASVDTASDSKVPLKDENARAAIETHPEPDSEDQQGEIASRERAQNIDQPNATTPSGEGNTVAAASDQPKADNGLETNSSSDSCPEPATEPMTPKGDEGYPGFDQKKASEPGDEGNKPPESENGKEVEDAESEEDESCLGKVPEDLDDDSPSRLEWLRQKREEGAVSKALDQAMCLIGLEQVKSELLQGKAAIDARRRRGEDLAGDAIVWHVEDNTGIERLFDEMEKEMGFDHAKSSKWRGERRVVKLMDYSDRELQVHLIKLIKKRGMKVEGSIDGPYPGILAARIGRSRGNSAFQNLDTVKQEFRKVAHRQAVRLHRDRIEWTKGGEQGDAPDDFLLTKEDLLGPPPADVREKSKAYRELNAMVGLDNIKEAVEELMDLPRANYELELQGKQKVKVNLNRVFMGPPGTGKTTAAKLFGQVLVDLDLVDRNEVICKGPPDLLNWDSGYTIEKTHKALVAGQGKVLIIDNASELCPDAPNIASTDSDSKDRPLFAIAETLATDADASSGQDGGCIFLVGEAQGLRDMFDKCHRGLRTRFSLDDGFQFPDYDPPELVKILEVKLTEANVTANEQAKKVAEQILSRARHRPGFGNCNSIDILIRKGLTSRRARLRNEGAAAGQASGEKPSVPRYSFWLNQSAVLEPEDFDPDWRRGSETLSGCEDLFKEFVGFGPIVRQFTRYQEIVAGMRLHGVDPGSHIPFTFVFKGPPGTGKTTTARKLGQIFYDMGFLTTNEVIECSVSDFIGSHLGETAPKLRTLLDKALGKVLFIDEAYRLANGTVGRKTGRSFEDEAVGELVDSLTKERYRRKVVVILVGYSDDMDRLMKANRGLHSRFATEVVFPQLTPGQCIKFLGQLIGQMGVSIRDREDPDPRQKEKVLRVMGKLIATRDWSNGRDIETLAAEIVGDVYCREGRRGKKSARLQVSTEELVGFLLEMLKGRRAGELVDEE